jgi:hypothetical protein
VNNQQNNGFIIVASRKYVYYQTAINCIESLKDFYPEAHVTFFTHKDWVDDRASICDNIITDIPIHKRAKLWALSKSPYDITMYLDADAEIQHEDVSTIFNTIKEHDIVMARVRPYCAAAAKFPAGELTHHCGMFVYKRSEMLYNLFDQWFEFYCRQTKDPWDLDPKLYPPKLLSPWDIFTFWRLINLEGWKDKINIGFWEEDARWNFHGFKEEELNGKPVIIYHHSIRKFDHEKNKSEEQGSN